MDEQACESCGAIAEEMEEWRCRKPEGIAMLCYDCGSVLRNDIRAGLQKRIHLNYQLMAVNSFLDRWV